MNPDQDLPTLNYLINITNAICGFDIRLDTRVKEYVFGRTLYYGLCKKYTHYSLASIGRSINKNHATVLHSLKNLERDVINNTDHFFAEKWIRANEVIDDLFNNKDNMKKYDMRIQLSLLSSHNERLISQVNELKNELSKLQSDEEKKLIELYRMLPEEDKHFLIMKAEVTLKMKEDEQRRIRERNSFRLDSQLSN